MNKYKNLLYFVVVNSLFVFNNLSRIVTKIYPLELKLAHIYSSNYSMCFICKQIIKKR